jgi:uncharacterized membrane protein
MCPACSARAGGGTAAASAGGLTDNVAGMLAYVTPFPAIIFLVTAPYNRSRFVRFHAFQSIFLCVALLILWFGFLVMDIVPGLIFIMFPLHLLVWLAAFVLWIVLLIKTNQGQMWKLPVIGDMAEKQANAA